MKFISFDFKDQAENEIYTYMALGAWNNTAIESYGIPTLYYSGIWKNYYILALTLLDQDFEQVRKAGQLTAIDKLLVFREMVSFPFFLLLFSSTMIIIIYIYL